MGFFTITPDRKIEFIIEQICETLGTDQATTMVLDNIPTLDIAGLAAFAPFLNGEELAHGRLASDSETIEKQHLNLDGIVKAEELFMQGISKAKKQRQFLSYDDLSMLMYLWSCFETKDYIDFWHNRIQEDPISICYLLASNALKWNAADEYGYNFHKETIEKVMKKEEIDTILLSSLVEIILDKMPDLIFEKTVCFYYNGFKDLGSFDRLSAQECRSRFLREIGREDK